VTGQSRTPSLLFSQSCAFSSSDKKDAAPPGRCGGLTPGTLFFRKEEKQLNNLTKALMEELTVEYVKVGPLQIPESVVISWVIMLLVVVGSILLTRNLKVDHISKRQAALEALYSLGKNFFEGLLGKEGSRYVPYLMTVALYIACSNVIGVFGVKPPTKDLDVTAALALMSIVLIEYAGVRARGGAGFLKSLAAPTPIMTPMNILEIAIRPTSLCMRLFGNVLGAFVIMELLKLVVPVFVPAVFSLYFDLFDGLIQTYVFVFLTALFMKDSIGGEE
jgi:F-type H+-transporting ATPase subunit a